MRRFLVSSIAIVSIARPALAEPRSIDAAAKLDLDRGLARFNAHDYVAAIAAFDAGFAIDPHPDFLYAKAQAQRMGGDCRGAVVSYTAFLASNPPSSEAERARANVARCEQMLATLPPVEPVEPVLPPPTEPTVESPTVPVKQAVMLHVEHARWWRDRTGLAFAAGGVALLAAGTSFVLLARSAADDAGNATDVDGWTASNNAWRTDRLVAGIGLGVGIGLVGVATIRFVLVRDRGDRTPTIGAAPTKDGAVVLLRGSW